MVYRWIRHRWPKLVLVHTVTIPWLSKYILKTVLFLSLKNSKAECFLGFREVSRSILNYNYGNYGVFLASLSAIYSWILHTVRRDTHSSYSVIRELDYRSFILHSSFQGVWVFEVWAGSHKTHLSSRGSLWKNPWEQEKVHQERK